jgi:hypothetical protein
MKLPVVEGLMQEGASWGGEGHSGIVMESKSLVTGWRRCARAESNTFMEKHTTKKPGNGK